MTPQVFVTQVPHRRHHDTWIPTVNISSASKFGQIRILMPHSMSVFDTDHVVKTLSIALTDYDYTRGDFLLMIGDPAIIAIASAIVSEFSGKFRLLKWEREQNAYVSVDVCISEEDNG